MVTPVHNTAEYLADCIRSVLAQSYPAWEYIIVNNASTDGSLGIAQSFAAIDPRIRIINTERLLPQIANFNFALRQISPGSRYCKMVLADDWIYPSCIAEMVALAETDPEIAIVSAYYHRDKHLHGSGLPCDVPDQVTTVVPGRDVCRLYLLGGCYVLGSPNTVLYRSDLVRARDPFFPELKYPGYFDDSQLCFEVLDGPKVGFVHQVLSYMCWGNDSVTTSTFVDNSYKLMRYLFVRKYGRVYLTDSEFRRTRENLEREYYKMLALSLFKGRGPKFWQYHANGIELAGDRLDWGRITAHAVSAVSQLIGEPQESDGRIMELHSFDECD